LSIIATLRAMSDEELAKWNKEQGGDKNAEKILKERADTRISGKVEAAGEDFWEQFPGIRTSAEQKSAMPFMKTLEYLKHTKGLDEFGAKRAFEELRKADPEGFKEKYGLDSWENIGKAIEKGYDEARLSNEEYLADADKRNLTASLGTFGTDANYVDANVFPTIEANVSDPSLVQPHGWEFGDQWQTAEEEDDSGNWLTKALSYMPLVGKNTRSGALMRMLTNTYMPEGGITSMFNRPTTAQQLANQRFIRNYNVGINPQTGRMTSGPFAGMNAPGTSMFGSQTPQQMAQNWMNKYGHMQYQTRKQQLKQQQIKNIATMNQGPAGTTPKAPRGPVGPPPGGGPHGNGGNQGSQPGSMPTGTGGRNPWGRAEGGLISLWRR
jgi:hypothetical protein